MSGDEGGLTALLPLVGVKAECSLVCKARLAAVTARADMMGEVLVSTTALRPAPVVQLHNTIDALLSTHLSEVKLAIEDTTRENTSQKLSRTRVKSSCECLQTQRVVCLLQTTCTQFSFQRLQLKHQ